MPRPACFPPQFFRCPQAQDTKHDIISYNFYGFHVLLVIKTRFLDVFGGMKRKHSDSDVSPSGFQLEVLCLTGEGLTLNVHHTTLGQEIYQMVSQQIPYQKGAKLVLHHMESKFIRHKSLLEQGITSAATLSCTRIPTNLYDAWCFVTGRGNTDESALQGVTELDNVPAGQYLHHLPRTLERLTFDDEFNQSLDQVTLPNSLQHLTFGQKFNRSLDRATLPTSLQHLTFGRKFNRSLDRATLPTSLRNLTFGSRFRQSLDQVALPDGLRTLEFGLGLLELEQSLKGVTLPSGLQSLKVDGRRLVLPLEEERDYLEHVEVCDFHWGGEEMLPNGLRSLTFAGNFKEIVEQVDLPSGLQSLQFSDPFNQSLELVNFPNGLQSLTLSRFFNQSLDQVTLPNSLKHLTFGWEFNQSLERVSLPDSLESLAFGNQFNQRLDTVIWPNGLQSLTFGHRFDQSLNGVIWPNGLQSLTFGYRFDQSLDQVTWPSGLQSLTFGHSFCFHQTLHQGTLPKGLLNLKLCGEYLRRAWLLEALPDGLQTLDITFSYVGLDGVTFPETLQSLTVTSLDCDRLDDDFHEDFERAALPRGLRHLSLDGVRVSCF